MNHLEAHPELNVDLKRRNFRSARGAVEGACSVSEVPEVQFRFVVVRIHWIG